MNRKRVIIGTILLFFFMLILFFSFAIAGNVMTAEADIYVPADIVSIEVQDYAYLGNITVGQNSETVKVKVYINNTGNVNVTVTPQLVDSNENLFKNLYFARITTVPYQKIGVWSINISKPSSGGVRKEDFWMKLDLGDYTGEITEEIGHKSDIIFIAVAQ